MNAAEQQAAFDLLTKTLEADPNVMKLLEWAFEAGIQAERSRAAVVGVPGAVCLHGYTTHDWRAEGANLVCKRCGATTTAVANGVSEASQLVNRSPHIDGPESTSNG